MNVHCNNMLILFFFLYQCLEKLSRKPNQMDEQLAGSNTNFNRYDSRFPCQYFSLTHVDSKLCMFT